MTIPWDAPDLYPAKPDISDYGYLKGGREVGCSEDDLIDHVKRDGNQAIRLVWVPEHERMVPLVKVPILYDAVKHRAISRSRNSLLGYALLSVLCVAGYHVLGGEGAWNDWQALRMVIMMYVILVGLPFYQSWQYFRQVRKWHSDCATFDTPTNRFFYWMGQRRVRDSWWLAGPIGVVLLLQVANGFVETIHAAGLMKGAVRDGELWRLLSYGLIHGSVFHFIMNGFGLLYLGKYLEALCSWPPIVLAFVLSTLGGGVASYLWLDADSAGASGGVLGLVGLLMVVAWRGRHHLPSNFYRWPVQIIILTGIIGIAGYDVIDNAAHGGGLLMGALVGLCVIPSPLASFPMRSSGWVRQLAVVGILVWLATAVLTVGKIQGIF